MFEAGPAFCSLNGTVTECIAAAEIALEWNGFASCIERKGDREPDEMKSSKKGFLCS